MTPVWLSRGANQPLLGRGHKNRSWRMRADSRIQTELGGHAGSRQPARVVDVLISEDVEVTEIDIGRRQAGQVGRAGRRRVWGHVVTTGRLSQQGTPAGEVVVVGPGSETVWPDRAQRPCRRASGRPTAVEPRRVRCGRAPSSRRPPRGRHCAVTHHPKPPSVEAKGVALDRPLRRRAATSPTGASSLGPSASDNAFIFAFT